MGGGGKSIALGEELREEHEMVKIFHLQPNLSVMSTPMLWTELYLPPIHINLQCDYIWR